MRKDADQTEKQTEPVSKYIAFWSDTAGGGTTQPSLRTFQTKEQVLIHLRSRLANLDGIYMRTKSQYRIESARVMREALTKLIRKLSRITDFSEYEQRPLNISGILAEYCEKHRVPTADVVKYKPQEPEAPPLPQELDFIEDGE